MFKLIKSIKLFWAYRKNIRLNEKYLAEKYGLNIDLADRLWTVIDLSEAPKEMVQQYGPALSEFEFNKYMREFQADLPRLDLHELVKRYEVKRVDTNKYGITFGFSQFNSVNYYIAKWTLIVGLSISAIIALLILI